MISVFHRQENSADDSPTHLPNPRSLIAGVDPGVFSNSRAGIRSWPDPGFFVPAIGVVLVLAAEYRRGHHPLLASNNSMHLIAN